MPFIANTDEQRREMLKAIGVESIEALFADIPPELRCGALRLKRGLTEQETRARLAELARKIDEIDARATDVEFGFADDGTLILFQARRVAARSNRPTEAKTGAANST